MPTKTKRRGELRYRGVVKQKGKIVASRWFGSGLKEKRKAAEWEILKRKELQEIQEKTPTDSLTALEWGKQYLDFSMEQHVRKTYKEKQSSFKQFLYHIGNIEMEKMNPAMAMQFLQQQHKTRSGYAVNKDRKNLSAAWEYGKKFIADFPQDIVNPFQVCSKFPEIRKPRYVPPIEDFDKVLAQAHGQDHLMLTAFLQLAARRGELFGLTWSDVDFMNGQVCLTTRKTRSSSTKRVWLPMTTELRKGLLWWWENRPYKRSTHVFIMLDNTASPRHNPGGPFKERRHFMKTICHKAGVKHFGFHAIRHLSAGYLYQQGKSVSLIQQILRHEKPGTTEIYLKNLGIGNDDLKEALEEFSKRASGEIIPFQKFTPQSCNSEG